MRCTSRRLPLLCSTEDFLDKGWRGWWLDMLFLGSCIARLITWRILNVFRARRGNFVTWILSWGMSGRDLIYLQVCGETYWDHTRAYPLSLFFFFFTDSYEIADTIARKIFLTWEGSMVIFWMSPLFFFFFMLTFWNPSLDYGSLGTATFMPVISVNGVKLFVHFGGIANPSPF